MTALTTTTNNQPQHSIADLERMAIAMHKSQLYGFKDPNQYLALMFIAQAENRHPATVVQDYHFFSGKASLKAEAALARFQEAGGSVKWIRTDETVAEAEFSHPLGGTATVKWTLEQAKKAGLTGKDNWQKYPGDMLRNRCIYRGVRTVYPGALNGMRGKEEVEDDPTDGIVEEPVAAQPVEAAKPIVPRASEVAQKDAATDAEFKDAAPATDAEKAAGSGAPMEEKPISQPPEGAIRIKDSVLLLASKDNPDPNAPADQKTRYGIKTANNGTIGTFDKSLSDKIAPILEADKQLKAVNPEAAGTLIDMAFVVVPLSGGKERRDMVWVGA